MKKPLDDFLMKKEKNLTLDQISTILGEQAKEKGLTRRLLAREMRRTRMELWSKSF